jgi:2-amino-4-hydroxy-6-hydroxymethyldihydropteridine diphosphokinase
MALVYLGLGANLGDREASLRAAVVELAGHVTVLETSSTYETAPWGRRDQPAFLNCCVAANTSLAPHALLALLKQIEARLGRVPAERWGPRVIDIDLLLYDDVRIADRDLVVPHPRLAERAFVLVPLAEIAGDVRIPGTALSVREALGRLSREPDDVRRVGDAIDWSRPAAP